MRCRVSYSAAIAALMNSIEQKERQQARRTQKSINAGGEQDVTGQTRQDLQRRAAPGAHAFPNALYRKSPVCLHF